MGVRRRERPLESTRTHRQLFRKLINKRIAHELSNVITLLTHAVRKQLYPGAMSGPCFFRLSEDISRPGPVREA